MLNFPETWFESTRDNIRLYSIIKTAKISLNVEILLGLPKGMYISK